MSTQQTLKLPEVPHTDELGSVGAQHQRKLRLFTAEAVYSLPRASRVTLSVACAAVPETHLQLSDSAAANNRGNLGRSPCSGFQAPEPGRFLVALNADVGFNRSNEVQRKVGWSQMLLVSVSCL